MIDILELADRAARCTLGVHPHWWTVEDWQDAAQQAALGIWRAMRGGAVDEAYLFTAAKTAIYDWMRRLRQPPTVPLLRNLTACSDQDDPTINLERLQVLVPWLAWSRKQTGGAATTAFIDREIAVLALIVQGYGNDAIAVELHIPRRDVPSLRRRLCTRLAQIAAQQGVQP